jgi:hypothetical protein
VGIALFAQPAGNRDTVQARAVGHFYDRLLKAPRRRWRAAGLGERQISRQRPTKTIAQTLSPPEQTPAHHRGAKPAMGLLETV